VSPSQIDRLNKMYCDMYEGNGSQNPSMTTRMAKVEEALKDIKYYFRAIVVMLAGLVFHALWQLIVKK
jgi:hypothetical protein